MPFYQFDASGIVERYVEETGLGWVRALVDPVLCRDWNGDDFPDAIRA